MTFATEIGDVRRFESPRQLMGYVGLVPGERSTGETVRRGGVTKAGNGRVRHMLVESAWTASESLFVRWLQRHFRNPWRSFKDLGISVANEQQQGP